ncbi:MAG: hypothetical protein KAW17_03395, partial [Candidatus Eisenbacteria sp.]|nr:hypothetical protein [Candidatus Eisenbacteria bacterium]
MKRVLLISLAACLVASVAEGQQTAYCGWEDGGTVLGMYGSGEPPIVATNVGQPDPVFCGWRSLKLEDNSPSGTPQAYIAWVTGLTDGAVVEACFWRYDITPGVAPSCRIWAHYTTSDDIDNYQGSAGGDSDYGPGTGWDKACWSWTFDSAGGTRDALVIECRTYSNPGVNAGVVC